MPGKASKPASKLRICSIPCCSITARCTASRAESVLVFQHDLLGPLHRPAIDWQHLIRDAQQRIKRWLNRVAALDGNIAMKNFLQHLGVGHQALAVADEFLQQPLGIDFVRMRRAHQVHGDVGIYQNQAPVPVP